MIPALVAALMPLIPGLIGQVEKIFADKPKAGPEKMATVIDMLRSLAASLVGSGKIPQADLPDVKQLQTLIEAVFQGAQGNAAPAGQLYLVRGTVSPVTMP